MRVLMLSPGTRGDVAPVTGLGAAFVADGHEVTIVANAEYSWLVAGAGCELAPITAAIAPPTEEIGGAKLRGVRAHLAALRTYMDQAATVAMEAARGADVIVTNAISPYGHDIAEGLGIPSVSALSQPWHPSAAYPPMIASTKDLGSLGNRLAGRGSARVRTPYDPVCERVRRAFGLPKESRHAGYRRRLRQGSRVHHGISPVVLPRPDDWPAGLRLDGFWWPHDPPDWTPPPALREFLDAGPAPLVVSLGSMPAGSVVAQAVTEAIQATKVRAILQGRELRAQAEHLGGSDVTYVDDVPHSWLLPRAAAVVHHAGAGIAAAALRAGIPSVPMPAHTDQPYWARRLVALRAATAPLPMKHASGVALTTAIETAVTSQSLRSGAQAIRDAMDGEDGTAALRVWLRDIAG